MSNTNYRTTDVLVLICAHRDQPEIRQNFAIPETHLRHVKERGI